MKLTKRAFGLALAAALALPVAARAQDTIKIGNTMPYSGPASAFGEIGNTLKAYFDKVNAEGGINGRKVEFISYDDTYAPPKTVEQARRLVERDKVLMLVGTFGSAHNMAIHKYVNQKAVPHIFLGSTANLWNDPGNYPWTMGWQPNAHIEGKIYGEYIAAHHGDKKIGLMYQNDEFGRSYLEGLMEGLGASKDNIVARATYEATDPTVDSQVTNLQAAGAEVFLNLSTPKFAAQAIRKAAELGWKPVQFIPTAAASVDQVLRPAGVENAQGVMTAAYLKDPTDPRWADDAGMNDFRAFMDKYHPKGNKGSVFSVIGYSWGQGTEYILKQAGNDLSRENVMKVATSLDSVELPLLLPGIVLKNSPDNYAPIQSAQLTRFEGEAWVGFDPNAK